MSFSKRCQSTVELFFACRKKEARRQLRRGRQMRSAAKIGAHKNNPVRQPSRRCGTTLPQTGAPRRATSGGSASSVTLLAPTGANRTIRMELCSFASRLRCQLKPRRARGFLSSIFDLVCHSFFLYRCNPIDCRRHLVIRNSIGKKIFYSLNVFFLF